MSTDFSSSNPFRRKSSIQTSAARGDFTVITGPAPIPYDIQTPDATIIDNSTAPKAQKTVKKVRVQSPPPSSPETDAWSASAAIPAQQNDATKLRESDPFEGTLSEDTDEEELAGNLGQAPANPFQKTLETMEGGMAMSTPSIHVGNASRASLDVDAFKRLLMTGNAGLSSPASSVRGVAGGSQNLGDGGSSTDTSSTSRQSIFEPIQETHLESPRSSHEISEPEEEERRGLTIDFQPVNTLGRKKPPPPSSRHGKLIKVELRDGPSSTDLQSPPASTPSMSQPQFNNSNISLSSSLLSATDLNKPLPPAPVRAGHEIDNESIFDKEAAGKTPESLSPSPSPSMRKRTPPAPPITRRHSQLVQDSKLTKTDHGRLTPRTAEDPTSSAESTPGRPRSDSGRVPPPPPTRRPGSIRIPSSSSQPLVSSPSPSMAPPVPPSRSSSVRQRPSVSSTNTPNSRRLSLVPPPPPPRHGRTSFDLSNTPTILSPGSRTSEEYSRSIGSDRRGSVASSISQSERPGTSSSGRDVLADLSALQREIDALRNASGDKQAT